MVSEADRQQKTSLREMVRSIDPEVRGRSLEVATWVWRIAGVCAALVLMVLAFAVFAETGDVLVFPYVLTVYLVLCTIFSGVVWSIRYIATGERRDFKRTMHEAAFGAMPSRYWAVLVVLYLCVVALAAVTTGSL